MGTGGLLTRTRAAARPLAPYRIAWTAALIIGLMLLNKLGTPGTVAFFVVLAVMILRGPRTAFQAIAICGLALMINIAFVPKSVTWTLGRLIIPGLAMIRFVPDFATARGHGRGLVVYAALLLYIAVMALCSIMSGWYTPIALLKLLNFWVCITAIWLGTMVLRARRIDLSEWFISLIVAAAALGLVSLVTGQSTNFVRGDSLITSTFVGAFAHPNVHGLFASLFVTFLSTTALFSSVRNRWLLPVCIAVWLLFMAWSASRTAFVASAFGLIVLAVYSRPFRRRSGWRLTSSLSRTVMLSGVVIGALTLLALDLGSSGTISKSVIRFINKNENQDALTADVILRSRQALIDLSWENFKENPVFGIGFGVAKTQAFVDNATLFTAPAEKGFLPTAVLEEGGILGAAAFAIFLIVLLTSMARERNVSALAAMATFLGGNLTEVSLFSPGGAGLLGWTMIGAAIILGDHCWIPGTFRAGQVTGTQTPHHAAHSRA
jgi:hypothetical protein